MPPHLGAMIPAQRQPDDVRTPPPVRTVVDPCACGHARAAHDHYRPGHDCGACGAAGCAQFRPEGGAARKILRRIGLAE